MPLEMYVPRKFSAATLVFIENANKIVDEYLAQGFTLTLRQLYYQFVSRALIPNTQKEYHRMSGIISNARLAGLIDWEAIEDRTRNVITQPHWDSPESIIRSAANCYKLDKWVGQEYRPEVWIEKDALVGVVEGVCEKFDVPLFSCRGYTSQSEMWSASKRFAGYVLDEQKPFIIHLGDHDPSGIDMTRDVTERSEMFLQMDAEEFELRRIALNYDQVEQYKPPPNFAKLTDSRAEKYIDEFGMSSWELDALEPSVLAKLVKETIEEFRDPEIWNKIVKREEKDRRKIMKLSKL